MMMGVAGAAACGARRGTPSTPGPVTGAEPGDPASGDASPPSGLLAHPLAELPTGTLGPFLGTGAAGRLAVWLEPGAKGSLFARALDRTGAPSGEARRLGETEGEPGLVAVKPTREPDGGFLVLRTERGSTTERVLVQLVRPDGAMGGPAAIVAEPDARVLWLDAFPTPAGALLLWAELGPGAARLYARALGASGVPSGSARELVPRALAWQATSLDGGIALGYVEPGPGGDRGAVALLSLGADGVARGRALRVSEPATALPDLDLVRVGDAVLLAWTDTRNGEPLVFAGTVDGRDRLTRPVRGITGGAGPEALVRLVPPLAGGPAHLIWEQPKLRQEAGRVVRITPVDPHGKLGPARAELAIADASVLPELVPTHHGLAALTLSPACPREAGASALAPDGKGAELPSCQAPALPLFVAFDRDLQVTAVEPLRLDSASGAAAQAAWGLSCLGQGCITLAALPGSPAAVHSVRLTAQSDRWLAPAATLAPDLPPRLASTRTLANLEPLAAVAAARVGAERLAAWLTYFDPMAPWVVPKVPASDGRRAPERARLQIARLDADPPQTTTVSVRARSLGGVALAAAPDRDEALLAWTALDQGRPQLFATRVSAQGQRLSQKMLTSSAGEKSAVAVVGVDDGWVLGWLDERHGAPVPYVARVDPTLRRIGAEQRLTTGPGAASGIALTATATSVLAVWTETRDPTAPSRTELHGVRLRAKDAVPLEAARRLTPSRGDARQPCFATAGDHPVLAWLEPGSASARQPAPIVALARLDAEGRPNGEIVDVPLATGSPSSLALSCEADHCRVAVGSDTSEAALLEAFSWSPTKTEPPRRLGTVPGPSGQLLPIAFVGDELVVGEQLAADRGRVQWLQIEW